MQNEDRYATRLYIGGFPNSYFIKTSTNLGSREASVVIISAYFLFVFSDSKFKYTRHMSQVCRYAAIMCYIKLCTIGGCYLRM